VHSFINCAIVVLIAYQYEDKSKLRWVSHSTG